MKEKWKDCFGYKGFYRVSNFGRIKAIRRRGSKGGFLSPTVAKADGYLIVKLSKHGRAKTHKVHLLVLRTFVGLCPLGKEACHSPDPSKTNCHLNNLRYDTHKANCRDRWLHGNPPIGENNPSAVLTPRKVRRIRYLHEKKGWPRAELKREFKVSTGCIQGVLEYRTWRHLC